MSLFITDVLAAAPAQATPASLQASPMGTVIMLVGMMLIFYFLLWRPQSKRQKEQKALIGSLNKGDEVITTGGIVGKLTKITEDFVTVNIADDIDIKLQKNAVTATLPKGTIKSIK